MGTAGIKLAHSLTEGNPKRLPLPASSPSCTKPFTPLMQALGGSFGASRLAASRFANAADKHGDKLF